MTHPTGCVTAAAGFRAAGVCCGIREGKKDLALLVSDLPAAAAGTFTTNRFCAAPVRLSRTRIAAGRARAIVANSGCANAATGDDFVLGVKELQLPDGTRRPYSIWLAGDYPKVLDGLCKLLSLDMHVVDVNWIGLKLRKLLNFGELNGSFWAQVPGESRQQVYPSTVAYIAELILHRYKVLGLLDGEGRAIGGAGALALPETDGAGAATAAPTAAPIIAGQACPSCGAHAYIRKDGCMFCTACGHQGECG